MIIDKKVTFIASSGELGTSGSAVFPDTSYEIECPYWVPESHGLKSFVWPPVGGEEE